MVLAAGLCLIAGGATVITAIVLGIIRSRRSISSSPETVQP
jgi:hypothetical protein